METLPPAKPIYYSKRCAYCDGNGCEMCGTTTEEATPMGTTPQSYNARPEPSEESKESLGTPEILKTPEQKAGFNLPPTKIDYLFACGHEAIYVDNWLAYDSVKIPTNKVLDTLNRNQPFQLTYHTLTRQAEERMSHWLLPINFTELASPTVLISRAE
jgi:hypothetical protein